MRILLISPGVTHLGPWRNRYKAAPPLGLAHLASYLDANGYPDVIIRDLLVTDTPAYPLMGGAHFGWEADRIISMVKEYRPDLVGITSMYTRLAYDLHRTTFLVKQACPQVPVVAGGSHVSHGPDYVLQDENIDAVCVGEGEQTFLEMVQALEKGALLSGKYGPGPLLELKNVPHPARHLLDMEAYIREAYYPLSLRARQTNIMTSRGCPYNCVFCTVKSVWGRTWRGFDTQHVVDEIESLVDDYNVGEITWQDDALATDRKRLEAICDEIVSRGIDVKMTCPNGVAHWCLDEELLDKMKQAGFYIVTFGIESGNPTVRKYIRKRQSLDQARRMVEHATRIGMWANSTNIIGFPYETPQQVEDTIRFNIEAGFDFAFFYFLQPNPCSDVYEDFKKLGLLDLDPLLTSAVTPEGLRNLHDALSFNEGVDGVYMKKEEVRQLINQAYKRFMLHALLRALLHPSRVLRKIRTREDLGLIFRIALRVPILLFRIGMGKIGMAELLWIKTKKQAENCTAKEDSFAS